MKKTAILFSGSAYNTDYSLDSLMNNFIEPNDADVFIVTTRGMKRRKTPSSDIPTAEENEKWNLKNSTTIVDSTILSNVEIEGIKKILGDRLKGFLVFEDNSDYHEYVLSERRKMNVMVNEYIDESNRIKSPHTFKGIKIMDSNAGTIRCVIDQYRHIKKAYELMELYEKENNFQYEYVVRARIDFICPFELNILHYTLNHDSELLYVCGTVLQEERIWADEYMWFSKRPMARKLFPLLDRMGLMNTRKYKTIEGNNDMIFDPEVQFGILLTELKLPIVIVKIFRSAQYSKGNDGFDYFNYKFRRNDISLDYEYDLVCRLPTDINEHLPILRKYAEECNHITELGTRYGNSTVAFMAACKNSDKKFIAYDPQWNEKIDYLKLIASENDINFEMKIRLPYNDDKTESIIEETDLLFIDTNHHCEECNLEMRLHSDRARRYIIFHDTSTFWEKGQGFDNGGCGLKECIEPFLANPECKWIMKERFYNNNGLMILERIKN